MQTRKKLRLLVLTINLISVFQIFGEEPILSYQFSKHYVPSKKELLLAQFKAEHFPINVPLIFMMKQLNGNICNEKKILIDANNRVIDCETKKEWFVAFGSFAKGEPAEVIICTPDKNLLSSIIVVPNPIEVKDEAGHVLSLKLLSPEGYNFWVEATGFAPFEKVEFCSISESEVFKNTVQASDDGQIVMGISPAVIGKKSGKASFEIKGINTKHLKLNYRWGPEALKIDSQ